MGRHSGKHMKAHSDGGGVERHHAEMWLQQSERGDTVGSEYGEVMLHALIQSKRNID
jgi:hypothetical protein